MSKEQDLNKYSVRPKVVRAALGYFIAVVGRILTKINIQGKENIPKKGPYIIVCNHFNILDPPFVILAIKKPISFLMASDQIVDNKFMWAPWLYGFIPTDRQNIAPSTIKKSLEVIEKGEILGVFPEGTTLKKVIRPAKKGAAFLAMRTRVPILPMSLIGMDNIWGNWFKFIRPKLQIKIGKQFSTAELPKERTARNEAIKQTGEEIMCRIAALLPEKYHGFLKGDERINNYRTNDPSANL